MMMIMWAGESSTAGFQTSGSTINSHLPERKLGVPKSEVERARAEPEVGDMWELTVSGLQAEAESMEGWTDRQMDEWMDRQAD